MKLLDAEQVKAETSRADDVRRERINALKAEEILVAKKLNETRERFSSETKRMDEELKATEESTQKRTKELIMEVNALEERKREALKPIREREIALMRISAALNAKIEAVKNRELEAEKKMDELAKALDEYRILRASLDEEKEILSEREAKLAADRETFEIAAKNRDRVTNLERRRLREFFEKENAKLDEKILMLKKQ